MIIRMGLEQMGDIIRDARECRKESQTILSERACVSQGWLSQVELGHVDNPSAARVRRVANALVIDPRRLFAAQYDIPFGVAEPPANISLDYAGLPPLQGESLDMVIAFAWFLYERAQGRTQPSTRRKASGGASAA